VTERIHLQPFTLCECEQYAQSLGLACTREDVCRLYMALGGIPFYWDMLRRDSGFVRSYTAFGKKKRESLLWRHVPDEVHVHGAQIDLLIDRADGVVDICEMKYSSDNTANEK